MNVRSTVLAFAIAATGFAGEAMAQSAMFSGPTSKSSCIVNAGALLCWGNNEYGQLGDGTVFHGLFPQVIIPAGVTQVSMGTSDDSAHSCAVVSGALKCWGSNNYGQLGDGTDVSSLVPKTIMVAPAAAALTVVSVTVGAKHTCAVLSDKSAKCWGANDAGQLGYGLVGDIDNSAANSIPVPYQAPRYNNGVPANLNTIALGMPFFKSNATTVIKTITALRAGSAHTCGLFGTVAKCWGKNDVYQTGNPFSGSEVSSPTNVKECIPGSDCVEEEDFRDLPGVIDIKLGGSHTCALQTSSAGARALKCWGAGARGQLGNGDTMDSAAPVLAMGNDVTAFELGFEHTCFTRYGGMKCFGANMEGQLGNGTTDDHQRARFVTGARTAINAIGLGYNHTCAVFGQAPKCWGQNEQGAVGDNVTDTDVNPNWPLVLTPANVAL